MHPLQPAIAATEIHQSEYQDVVASLQTLCDRHERPQRLAIGQLILQRFFDGKPASYSSHDPTKPSKFKDFFATHAEDLARLDHSDQTLRRCVRVRICYDLLPPGVRDQLAWSALLAISGLGESNQRAQLAAAALAQDWSVAQVRAAVEQARSHRLWDADPSEPGLQLPDPKPAPPPQPGRLVTRSEKWHDELSEWQAEFARIDPSKLSGPQRQRLKAALGAAKEKIAELEGVLGE